MGDNGVVRVKVLDSTIGVPFYRSCPINVEGFHKLMEQVQGSVSVLYKTHFSYGENVESFVDPDTPDWRDLDLSVWSYDGVSLVYRADGTCRYERDKEKLERSFAHISIMAVGDDEKKVHETRGRVLSLIELKAKEFYSPENFHRFMAAGYVK